MIKIKATRFMTVKDIEAEHTGRIDTLKSELKCFKGDESRRIKLQELLNKFQCSDLKKVLLIFDTHHKSKCRYLVRC